MQSKQVRTKFEQKTLLEEIETENTNENLKKKQRMSGVFVNSITLCINTRRERKNIMKCGNQQELTHPSGGIILQMPYFLPSSLI